MKYQQLHEEYPLTGEQIEQYRQDGFIKLENVITGETLQALRDAVAGAVDQDLAAERESRDGAKPPDTVYSKIFIQRVNLWQRFAQVKPFVLSPRLANIAAQLSGGPVRVWHDQALFKEPQTGSKTPWHQDAPYWPHRDRSKQLSIWIALKDATIQNGCMSFLPGTQKFGPKEPVLLEAENPQGVFDIAPEASGIKATVRELKAGSVTFHHGLCFHYAGPNRSDAIREAFVVIYMPADTLFNGDRHVVTDGRGYTVGGSLDDEMFPLVSTVQQAVAV